MRVAPPLVAVGLAAVLVMGPLASTGRAADATPEQLEFAAHEHDLGYRAYVAKQFEEAATHFENAYFSAPNAAELRSAVRARKDAGQLARAATLAALGQRKYPEDAAMTRLAEATTAEARPKTFEVHVTSAEGCNVAVDAKVVAAEKVTDFRFYVDPGHHTLLVGWSDDRSLEVSVDATAGGSRELALTPPKPAVRAVPSPGSVGAGPTPSPAVSPTSSKPFGPAVFVVGAGLTAALGGVTVWSGIDTQNNPGRNAVKSDCVGQGTSCPQYQQGLSAQTRTNVLLATTGAIGLVTAVIGVFFTQWSAASPAESAARAASGLRIAPVLGPGQAGLRGEF